MYILFNLVPNLAKVFSNGSFFLHIKLLVMFWWFAITRKTFFKEIPKKFCLNFFNKNFEVTIGSIVDLATLKEVFLLEEYAWSPIENPKIIIDIGAHFGDTALYYHLKYPEAHIYAIEPAPNTYERLVKNVSDIEKITPINAAVGSIDGTMDLYMTKSSMGNSFKARESSQDIISVTSYTLRSLFDKYNLDKADIIKFDIEGGEEGMFEVMIPEEYAGAYIGEIHEDLISINFNQFAKRFNKFNVQKENLSNPKRFIFKALIKK